MKSLQIIEIAENVESIETLEIIDTIETIETIEIIEVIEIIEIRSHFGSRWHQTGSVLAARVASAASRLVPDEPSSLSLVHLLGLFSVISAMVWAQHWSCLACGVQNWSTNRTCRACFTAPWPAPSVAAAKKKNGTGKPASGGAGSKSAALALPPPAAPPAGGASEEPAKHPAAQLKVLQATRESLASAGVASSVLESTDAEIARLTDLTKDLRPIGQRLDGLRGVISRGEARLAAKEAALEDARKALEDERAEVVKHKAQLQALEEELAAGVAKPFHEEPQQTVPPWLRDALLGLARTIHRGTDMNGTPLDNKALAASLARMVEPVVPDNSMSGVPRPEVSEISDEELELELAPLPPAPASEGAEGPGTAGTSTGGVPSTPSTRVRGKALVETPQVGKPGSVTHRTP